MFRNDESIWEFPGPFTPHLFPKALVHDSVRGVHWGIIGVRCSGNGPIVPCRAIGLLCSVTRDGSSPAGCTSHAEHCEHAITQSAIGRKDRLLTVLPDDILSFSFPCCLLLAKACAYSRPFYLFSGLYYRPEMLYLCHAILVSYGVKQAPLTCLPIPTYTYVPSICGYILPYSAFYTATSHVCHFFQHA